jgi:hypothetical protein
MDLNRNASLASPEAADSRMGSSNRGFGFVFCAFFLLVAIVRLRRGGEVRWWAVGVAAIFGVLAAVRPQMLSLPNRLWTWFGDRLHQITSPIALGLIYIVGIVPVGLLMRIMGKDPLRRKWNRNEPTYWITRDPPGRADREFKHQF